MSTLTCVFAFENDFGAEKDSVKLDYVSESYRRLHIFVKVCIANKIYWNTEAGIIKGNMCVLVV